MMESKPNDSLKFYQIAYGSEEDFHFEVSAMKRYHEECLVFIKTIEKCESINAIQELVKTENIKIPLQRNFNFHKLLKIPYNSTERNSEQVHIYLLKCLVTNHNIEEIQFPEKKNMKQIEDYLIKTGKLIKIHQSKLFYLYAAYGYFLDLYFNHYKKISTKQWKVHVKEKFMISEAYARRLRDVGKLVNQYQKLKYLNISFRKFCKVLPDVKKMLCVNEFQLFWGSG